MILIRTFQPEDYEMVCQWYTARKSARPFVPRDLLPPVGQIAFEEGEDLAAMWLYLAAGCPVAFIEYAIARPGLSYALILKAFLTIEEGLKAVATMFNCRLLVSHARPAFVRYMERGDWKRGVSDLVAMYKVLEMQPSEGVGI